MSNMPNFLQRISIRKSTQSLGEDIWNLVRLYDARSSDEAFKHLVPNILTIHLNVLGAIVKCSIARCEDSLLISATNYIGVDPHKPKYFGRDHVYIISQVDKAIARYSTLAIARDTTFSFLHFPHFSSMIGVISISRIESLLWLV